MNDDGQHEYDIDIPSAKRLIIVMQSRLLYAFSNAVLLCEITLGIVRSPRSSSSCPLLSFSILLSGQS